MRSGRVLTAIALSTLALGAGAVLPAGAQIPVGGWSSPNVEWLGNVTLSGTTGAIIGRLHGNYFYAEALEAIEIFDVSTPTAPKLMSRIPLQPYRTPAHEPGYPDIGRDRMDTNGRVMISATAVDQAGFYPSLFVYDIRDKGRPRLVGQLDNAGYAFSCVLQCAWAYAASGQIIDLRDPSRPRLAGRWDGELEFTSTPCPLCTSTTYSITEVSPGRVLTASTPMYLLDVSRPTKPRVLAESDGSPHSRGWVVWPHAGVNGIALSVQPSFSVPRCELKDQVAGSSFDSAFKTWDMSHWKATGLITAMSEYRLRNGTYQDGDPAFSGAAPTYWGCGTTGVDAHSRFKNGGLAVVAGSSHGVKFLEIDRRGRIEEVGWFLPYANDTFGAYWITDEIVYTVDWPRGIDILRFDANA